MPHIFLDGRLAQQLLPFAKSLLNVLKKDMGILGQKQGWRERVIPSGSESPAAIVRVSSIYNVEKIYISIEEPEIEEEVEELLPIRLFLYTYLYRQYEIPPLLTLGTTDPFEQIMAWGISRDLDSGVVTLSPVNGQDIIDDIKRPSNTTMSAIQVRDISPSTCKSNRDRSEHWVLTEQRWRGIGAADFIEHIRIEMNHDIAYGKVADHDVGDAFPLIQGYRNDYEIVGWGTEGTEPQSFNTDYSYTVYGDTYVSSARHPSIVWNGQLIKNLELWEAGGSFQTKYNTETEEGVWGTVFPYHIDIQDMRAVPLSPDKIIYFNVFSEETMPTRSYGGGGQLGHRTWAETPYHAQSWVPTSNKQCACSHFPAVECNNEQAGGYTGCWVEWQWSIWRCPSSSGTAYSFFFGDEELDTAGDHCYSYYSEPYLGTISYSCANGCWTPPVNPECTATCGSCNAITASITHTYSIGHGPSNLMMLDYDNENEDETFICAWYKESASGSESSYDNVAGRVNSCPGEGDILGYQVRSNGSRFYKMAYKIDGGPVHYVDLANIHKGIEDAYLDFQYWVVQNVRGTECGNISCSQGRVPHALNNGVFGYRVGNISCNVYKDYLLFTCTYEEFTADEGGACDYDDPDMTKWSVFARMVYVIDRETSTVSVFDLLGNDSELMGEEGVYTYDLERPAAIGISGA
jgi:hypothetical protein